MPDASSAPIAATVPDRRRARLEALVVALSVALALVVFRLPRELALPGAFNDDGVYLALGRALARGEGYRSIYLVGAPLQVKFPPGLPLVLAPLWLLLGTGDTVAAVASLLGTAAAAAAAGLFWWVGRTRLALPPAALALLVAAPFLMDLASNYYSLVITEAWFALGWALALVLAARLEAGEARVATAVSLGLVIAATVLFRTQAITLLPAALFGMLLARRRREAVVTGVAALLPLLAWQLTLARARAGAATSAIPDEAGYGDWVPAGGAGHKLAALVGIAIDNAHEYATLFSYHLSRHPAIGLPIVVAFMGLAVIGSLQLWRRAPTLVASVWLAFALLAVWPSRQDRLLLPVLPALGLLAAAGAAFVARRTGRPGTIALAAAGAAALLVAALRQPQLRGTASLGISGEGVPYFQQASYFLPRNSRIIAIVRAWAETSAQPDDRILTSLPAGVWLATGRLTSPGEPNQSLLERSVWDVPTDYLERRIRDDGITVVVVDAADRPLARDVRLLANACPGGVRFVGGAGNGRFPILYRVDRAARECVHQAAEQWRAESR